MSFAIEASLLLAATLGASLLAYWFLLARYRECSSSAPPDDRGPLRHISAGSHPVGASQSPQGHGTPRPPLCKNCRKAPWAGGPEMLCAACEDDRLDLFDEFSRGQLDGAW